MQKELCMALRWFASYGGAVLLYVALELPSTESLIPTFFLGTGIGVTPMGGCTLLSVPSVQLVSVTGALSVQAYRKRDCFYVRGR